MANKKADLVIWDIDGTLTNLFDYIPQAYSKAFKEVCGTDLEEGEIEKGFGLPEQETVGLPLRKRNISEKYTSKIISYKNKILGQVVEDIGTKALLPGVSKLVKVINNVEIPQGVVTGNVEEMGKKIINSTGLIEYFDEELNQYAVEGLSRSQMLERAITFAKKKYNLSSNLNVYTFGDTASDVRAAKDNNAISIILRENGQNLKADKFEERMQKIKENKPGYILDNLKDTEKILEILGINYSE